MQPSDDRLHAAAISRLLAQQQVWRKKQITLRHPPYFRSLAGVYHNARSVTNPSLPRRDLLLPIDMNDFLLRLLILVLFVLLLSLPMVFEKRAWKRRKL